jgi:hypothetical protein
VVLSNSRADEKTEKEKKRHSASPGKGKHVSPKVMFVHHDDPKVEENLRMRGKSTFTDLSIVFCNIWNIIYHVICRVVIYLEPELTYKKYGLIQT